MNTNKRDILILCDDYFSNRSGAQILRDLSTTLSSKGNRVTVIAPHNHADNYREELIHKNVRIKTFYFPNIKVRNNALRACLENLSILPFFFLTLWVNRNNKYQGLIYYSPSIFIGTAVYFLKKIFTINTYLIQRDIFPDWAVESRIIKKDGLVHLYFQYFSEISYKSADRIGVMSKSSIQTISKYNISTEKIQILPNWLSNKYVDHIQTNSKFRVEKGLVGKVVFFYAGNIGQAQHIESLFPILEEFKDDNKIAFAFFGSGDSLQKLKDFCTSIPNANYYGNIPEDEYYAIAQNLDVGLICLNKELIMSNYPGKCLGYMVMKKPFMGLMNPGNDMIEEIEDFQIGRISYYEENYHLSLVTAIKYLSENVGERKKMGKNGYKLLSEKYSTDRVSDQILHSLFLGDQ